MKINKQALMLFVMMLVYAMGLHAQESPFRLGIKGGVALSNMSVDLDDDESQRKSALPGYVVGLTGEYAFSDNLFLASELLFLSKGFNVKGMDQWEPRGETHWKKTVNMHYVQIPLLITYKFKFLFADDGRIVLQAGPYVAYGIAGKMKTRNRYEKISKEDDSEKHSTFGYGGFDRWDYGVSLRFGGEWSRYSVAVNLDGGLRDINNAEYAQTFWGRTCKNITGYLTFGYSF